jgi:transcriptional regulator with XRE-family HTH domain
MGTEPEGNDVETLGQRIKRLRQAKGLTQDRLAIEAHIDQSGLSKLERGKERSMSKVLVMRIAGVLSLSFEELVANTDFSE